jgi:hypothetical protein
VGLTPISKRSGIKMTCQIRTHIQTSIKKRRARLGIAKIIVEAIK